MHLSPLTGIETIEAGTSTIAAIRCIFHPLRGLKQGRSVLVVFAAADASFTPYGD